MCRNYPFTRCIGKLCPHQSAYADSFPRGGSLSIEFKVIYMTTTMNRLPVSTWNPLGVNYATASAALPAVPAAGWAKAEALSPALPAGVTAPAAADFGSFAVSGMGAETDAWLAANANLVNHLAVTGTADAPVVFETALDADHPHALTYLTIDAAAGSSLTVVQVVRGDAEGGVSANLTRIRAAEGAHVVLVQVQLLGNRARRWNAVAIEQGTSARVEQVRIELGGSVVACGARTLLNHNKCEYDLDAVYFGHSNDVLDFNDVSVHTGRDTLCEMHTAGVLTGSADKILRGTVDFQRGAKRGVGHESEDVLLFSPSARNRTAPLILCGEEEVEGQHAASVGRLDENKLYYLRSQARRLMVDARFAPAIDKIPLDSLQDEVRENVARRLNDELDG